MHGNQPLGPLAHAVLDQVGDLARRAVGSAVERRAGTAGIGGGCRVLGHVFTDSELADQHLKPGNWVTVGSVGDGVTTTLIEINLGTWEVREVRV